MNNTEETLNFEQKHKEDLQRLRGFRLLDDDFMSKVFEDKACAEFLLQIILQRHDLKVQSVQGQYDIKNLQGRSIRLDILAVDTKRKHYLVGECKYKNSQFSLHDLRNMQRKFTPVDPESQLCYWLFAKNGFVLMPSKIGL